MINDYEMNGNSIIRKINEFSLKGIYNSVVEDYKFDRSVMPQIKTDDLDNAIKVLKGEGINVSRETIDIQMLKSSQHDIITQKVTAIAKKLKEFDDLRDMKPIVISNDNFIVDGHHRIEAVKSLGYENVVIPVIIIDLPQLDAIRSFKEVAQHV